MRPVLALSVALLVSLCGTGCIRSTMNVVPDRGNHAAGPSAGGGGGNDVGADRTPKAGETTYIWTAGDTIYGVADKFGTTTRWVIQRNNLVNRPNPGTAVIVPAKR